MEITFLFVAFISFIVKLVNNSCNLCNSSIPLTVTFTVQVVFCTPRSSVTLTLTVTFSPIITLSVSSFIEIVFEPYNLMVSVTLLG